MNLLPYGAGTLPFATAIESCDYIEQYFSEFPFLPQDFESEALVIWKGRTFPRIKTQAWGPVSGEIEDFTRYCDSLEKFAKDIEPLAPKRWLVLDEPMLQNIGTPFFSGNPELAVETINAVGNSTNIREKWGIHICGNTDFSMISRLDVNIFHFDAYLAWVPFKLYKDDIEVFVSSGGIVAPGAVPVGRENGERDRIFTIVKDAVQFLEDLGQQDLPIGPACGMKLAGEDRGHEIGELIREMMEV